MHEAIVAENLPC